MEHNDLNSSRDSLGLGRLYRTTGQPKSAQHHLATPATMFRDMAHPPRCPPMLTPYFASLPSEREDAARIDGCTWFTAICLLGLLPTVLLVLLRRKDIVRGLVAGRSRGGLDADAAAWKDPAAI